MSVVDDVAQGMRRIIGATNDKLGLAIMEGLVLKIFDQFSEVQLYEAICCDRNLWAESWGDYERYRESVMLIAQDKRYAQYANLLTVENVLEWLRRKDGKPSFASIIVNTPNGPAWLDTQIQSLLKGASKPMKVKENV